MKYIVSTDKSYKEAYCFACVSQNVNKCDKQCLDKG
ncbi:Cys-rich peptide, Clo7bot family [Pseudobutyrivibrio sp. JW11]|nr:Cys-rich peptide, Clo7bot family [Pseudobutyrivibrio sp. JW11]